MIELDVPLSWIARRIRPVPGARRIARVLQGRFAKKYRASGARWVTLFDFDGDLSIRINRASYMGSSIYWNGYFSMNEVAVLRDLLTEESVFVDAGAHAGELTLIAAKRCTRGCVFAFEPAPAVFSVLEANIQANGFSSRVRAFLIALSDEEAEIELYSGLDSAGADFEDDIVCSMFEGHGRIERVARARSAPLDHFALERLDVMKLDVEGAEMRILRGARQTIERTRPKIISELAEPLLRAAGSSIEEVALFFEELGYQLHLITDYSLLDSLRARRRYGRLVPLTRHTIPRFCNVLALPR